MYRWLDSIALSLVLLCIIGFATSINDPVKVGSSTQKDPVKVGSSTQKDPVKVGSSTQKDPVKVGSSSQKDPVKVGSPSQKDPVKVGSPSQKDPVNVGSSSQKDPVNVGSSSQKDPVNVGSSSQKDPVKVGSSSQKDPVKVGSSSQKDPVKVGSSSQKDPVNVGSSSQKDIVILGSSTSEVSPISGSQVPKEPIGSGFITLGESVSREGLTGVDRSAQKIANILNSGFSGERYGSEELNATITLLSDSYFLEKLTDRLFIDTFYNRSEYYKKSGTKFDCNIKDIIRLFGNGILSSVSKQDPGCGRRAAYAEWLLERHGIPAKIVVAPNFYKRDLGHAWVEIPVSANKTYCVDLSKNPGYNVFESKNNIKYEDKRDFWVYNDIYDAVGAFGLKKFAWWGTEWGYRCMGDKCEIRRMV